MKALDDARIDASEKLKKQIEQNCPPGMTIDADMRHNAIVAMVVDFVIPFAWRGAIDKYLNDADSKKYSFTHD